MTRRRGFPPRGGILSEGGGEQEGSLWLLCVSID